MKTKHTQGEWNYLPLNDGKDGFDIFADGLYNKEIGVVYQGNEANAILITAAPEMFEALKMATKQLTSAFELTGDAHFRTVNDFVKQVIKKASPQG